MKLFFKDSVRWSLFGGFFSFAVLAPLRAQTAYGYSPSAQYYTVPAGVYTLHISLWGGGGGAASYLNGSNGIGGGAGSIETDVAVTPNQQFTIYVGQGGSGWNTTEGYGGSNYPNGGTSSAFAGGGGGRTEVDGPNGIVLIAGGGGGGGYPFNGPGGQGGGAGGSSGAAGASSALNHGGGGGTQTAGGAGGVGDVSTGLSGALRQGGNGNGANSPPGGGGDGYYGGGAGGGGATGVNDSAGGGGGGSSYAAGSGLSNLQIFAANGAIVGNVSGSNRLTSGASAVGNFGNGDGSNAAGDRGGNGRVVITAIATVPSITSALSIADNQSEYIQYQITASGGPTSYSATPLPTGVTFSSSTGLISGNPSISGSFQTTIQAINSTGTDTKTLNWTVTGAVISASPTVPSSGVTGTALSIKADGYANFGISHIENSVLCPDNTWVVLPVTAPGTIISFTPSNGPGTYQYRCRVDDIYGNYNVTGDYFAINVAAAQVTPPSSFQASAIGSTFVTVSWSGATAIAGIDHYEIYQGATLVGTAAASASTFTDNTIAPSTQATYTIYTVDKNGLKSAASSAVQVTTAIALEVFSPVL